MDLRYFEFDPSFESLKELMGKLRRLFDQLLMRTAGDVEEALRWMEALGQQHGFFEHGLCKDSSAIFCNEDQMDMHLKNTMTS